MFKKLDACTDIAQVIERNTGMTNRGIPNSSG